jgi:hypothetical protein
MMASIVPRITSTSPTAMQTDHTVSADVSKKNVLAFAKESMQISATLTLGKPS